MHGSETTQAAGGVILSSDTSAEHVDFHSSSTHSDTDFILCPTR